MACYACEYCELNIDNGGKCNHFEYNCLFDAVKSYDKDKIDSILESVNNVLNALKQLEHVDNESCFGGEIDAIKFNLTHIEDQIDDCTINEWNEINNNENC